MVRQLRGMQAFLRDADEKRWQGHAVAYWVEQVRDIAFDAEDIVDMYILNIRQYQMQNFIKRYACIFWKVPVRHNIGMKIEEVKIRLGEINEHRIRYGIDYNVGENIEETSWVERTVKERRELAIQRKTNVMVGFEDDMKRIKQVLFDQGKKRLCVISLVGMGGAGKSTLARRICDDSSVKEQFGNQCALVTVSQSYTICKVLKDIAIELRIELKTNEGEREIRQKLYDQLLQGGKYLIVLDDVWETEVWTLIQDFLPDEQNGSRVIITTRSMDVARFADPSTPPHELKVLDKEKSWELFTQIVFPDEEVEKVCTEELEELGQEIVKHCGGLPLALVVMGGLLRAKERSVRVWQNVKEGFDWQGSREGEASLKTLSLSYEAMPPHLKSCFLYFSCFPEDFEIDAEKLARCWVAEGFIPDEEKEVQRRKKMRMMEEIAEGWLEDLIQRCMVQVAQVRHSGRVKTCRIHDLLQELAISKSKEVNFFYTCHDTQHATPPNTARRLALHPSTEEAACTVVKFSAPKLRTLLQFDSSIESLKLINRFKLLRVLDLPHTPCRTLPSAVGNILIHLRYLGLRYGKLGSLPSSISRLRNLQTLDVWENNNLNDLPNGVWEIKTLRHVFIQHEIKVLANARRVDLVNLQTLKEAKAGSWIKESLARMMNLRVLTISDILPDHHLALTESLNSLLHLRMLECHGKALPRKVLALPDHRVLEELILSGPLEDRNDHIPSPNYSRDELPPNLTKLVLYGSRLQQDPWTLLEKLPHLRQLEMKDDAYMGEEAVCSAGGFPQLRWLKLSDLEHIKQLRVEDGAMPRISHLSIDRCEQLTQLPPQLRGLSDWPLTYELMEDMPVPEQRMRKVRAHALFGPLTFAASRSGGSGHRHRPRDIR